MIRKTGFWGRLFLFENSRKKELVFLNSRVNA
jgi:hypothetical protein